MPAQRPTPDHIFSRSVITVTFPKYIHNYTQNYSLPMKDPQTYQHLLAEVHCLRKCLSAQKLAHQSTLAQLQTSHCLNQQLQAVVQSQQAGLTQLHHQLQQKSQQVVELSTVYEEQLQGLKLMIGSKEEELHAMRGALMVTDYDVVRLRVVSEMEGQQRELVEGCQTRLRALEGELAAVKGDRAVLGGKCEHLRQEMEAMRVKYEQEMEDKDRKFGKETAKIHEQCEKERKHSRELDRKLEQAQKKYQSLHEKYQEELSRAYEGSKPSILATQANNYGYGNEEKSSRLKQEILSKEEEISSLRKKIERQASRNQQKISDLEQKLKQAKASTVEYDEHVRRIKEKERQNLFNIESYQRKIKSMREQHEQQILRVTREGERKAQELKQRLKAARAQKQNISSIANEQRSEPSPPKLRQKIRYLEAENDRLNQEVQLQVQRTRKPSSNPSAQKYRQKLQQANSQILALLKQKVALKQQLSTYAP